MRGFVLVVAVGLLAACVTREEALSEQNLAEKLAEAECEARFACDCRYPGYESQSECVAALTQEHEEDFEAARDAGLVFNLECAEVRLEREREALSCSMELAMPPCEDACRLYHGTKTEDEPCTRTEGNSDCAQGLWCATDDVCTPNCGYFAIPVGGSCVDDAGESYGYCDWELYCNYDTGVCEVETKIGYPCTSSAACEFGGWCDPSTNVCVARPGEGDPCTADHDCVTFDCGDDGTCLSEEAWLCPLPPDYS